jgi:NAD(P)-dependent dehydrogenase (short-subunit alcohol dehydrogenase family)
MDRLKNKVAIITGAAGGIGSAAVRLFVEEGAKVLAVDQSEAALAEAITGLDPACVSAYAADVTREDQVEAYTQAAVSRYGGLDIAILNAGVFGGLAPITEFTAEAFDRITAVNMRGPWFGIRAAFPHMKARGGGSIVITSSIQGISAIPFSTGYTTTKHAVVGMMRGAALEGAQHNIRVNTVNPGLTDTSMMGGIHESQAQGNVSAAAVMDAWAATAPMRRYAKPREIAHMMLFLASDDASYCSGSTYVVDGGLTASWVPTPEWQ